jgi:ABC-2 type transport system permease protein
MESFWPLFKREFFSYFRSPIAYVFIIIFILASIGCAFFLGNFYESNQASLHSFFTFVPWLYLVLVPAVGMRLWAEERRSGTIEILLTLPIKLHYAVFAKFLAGWAFIAVALALTFPIIMTVNYLGEPDNGVILSGYLGSLLMAGGYLSISCCTSALSKNQVVSFVLSGLLCFLIALLGWGVFTSFLSDRFPAEVIQFIASLGFFTHFEQIAKGVLDSRDFIYFFSVIAVGLTINTWIIAARRMG